LVSCWLPWSHSRQVCSSRHATSPNRNTEDFPQPAGIPRFLPLQPMTASSLGPATLSR